MNATSTLPAQASAPAVQSQSTYNYSLGYLRAFIVVLVVAHHAALAYHPFAPPPPASLITQPRFWQAFPVVDPARGSWAALFTGFNDTFFMSLMFLLSGLFVWSGLKRKGAAAFLRGRLLRLGLPFIVAAGLLAPLAYYPTYLQIPSHSGFDGFVHQWLSLGAWPAGPAWFIWVLLVFDCIAALLFAVAPTWAETVGRFLAGPQDRPARLFTLLLVGSALVYVPLALVFTGLHWTSFGPFTFQTSRILHYLLYFLVGVGIGAWGVDHGPLMSHGKLARRWLLWAVSSVVVFLAASAVAIAFFTAHLQSKAWEVSADLMFTATCAASCFALLALFLRFAQSRSRLFDSVSRNSYGIYLVHYAFVSWLQLAMAGISMPAALKFAIVVSGALAASWFATIAVRRIPGIARIV
jgi:peptidoglycan/LPS O-acetylase OafA/YrhL